MKIKEKTVIHLGILIGFLAVLLAFGGNFTDDIKIQHEEKSYAFPLQITNDKGEVFEYVRPLDINEMHWETRPEIADQIVFENNWYKKIKG